MAKKRPSRVKSKPQKRSPKKPVISEVSRLKRRLKESQKNASIYLTRGMDVERKYEELSKQHELVKRGILSDDMISKSGCLRNLWTMLCNIRASGKRVQKIFIAQESDCEALLQTLGEHPSIMGARLILVRELKPNSFIICHH